MKRFEITNRETGQEFTIEALELKSPLHPAWGKIPLIKTTDITKEYAKRLKRELNHGNWVPAAVFICLFGQIAADCLIFYYIWNS